MAEPGQYRIHSIPLMHIQLPYKFLLLQFSAVIPRAGPVNIINRRNPNCPEFIFGLGESSKRPKNEQASKKYFIGI